MNVELLKSTADLRRVQTQMRRRVVAHQFKTHQVQVTNCGTHYRARFAGGADATFGTDPQQAVQRLHKLPNMVRSVCAPKKCDLALERAEQRAERAVSKFVKSVKRFAPKRG